jgi:N-methylhydantoinase B
MKYPIEVRRQEIIADSEGAGRFRGAPGAHVEYGPVDTRLEVIYMSDGTLTAPLGVRGGLEGAKASQLRRKVDGSTEPLGAHGRVVLEAGETIVSLSTGGGGYGPPAERDAWRVTKDVREGWVTRERAASVYGVVLTDDGSVDEQRTGALRDAMTGAVAA